MECDKGGWRGERVIRQKVVKPKESVRAKKSVNWGGGHVVAGIFITVVGLFLLFVAIGLFLMIH